jgi:hypothetical protein
MISHLHPRRWTWHTRREIDTGTLEVEYTLEAEATHFRVIQQTDSIHKDLALGCRGPRQMCYLVPRPSCPASDSPALTSRMSRFFTFLGIFGFNDGIAQGSECERIRHVRAIGTVVSGNDWADGRIGRGCQEHATGVSKEAAEVRSVSPGCQRPGGSDGTASKGDVSHQSSTTDVSPGIETRHAGDRIPRHA